jgi:hypothetical protein
MLDLDTAVKSVKLGGMKTQRYLAVTASVLAGGFFGPVQSWAALPASYEAFARPAVVQTVHHKSALEYMPIYGIPSRYLFTGNYITHLSITELRIDHISDDSRCTRQNRTFMISAGYSEPIGNRLGSGRVELPFLSADSFLLSRLTPASVGDYVVHLSNEQLYSAAAQLFLTARF